MGQRMFVSSVLGKIDGYLYANVLKGIDLLGVDTLVYHSSADDSLMTKVIELANIGNKNIALYYVNNELDSMIYNTVTGIGGAVYDTETYLVDKESLDFLISGAGNLGTEVHKATESMEPLKAFVQKVTESNEAEVARLLTNKNWLEALNNAISTMSTSLVITAENDIQTVEFVESVSNSISKLQEKNAEISADLNKVQDTLKTLKTNPRQVGQNMMENAITNYGVYSVPPLVPNVMYVNCYGDVPHLVTFLSCFATYLNKNKNNARKTKLLLIKPLTYNYNIRYEKFKKLTTVDAHLIDMDTPDINYVTYEPTKRVLDTFFSEKIAQYIVIDCTQSGENLLTGHMVRVFNAYASPGVYNKLTKNKMGLSRTIFSGEGLPSESDPIVIPNIPSFATMPDKNRSAISYKSFKDQYMQLLRELG